MIEEATIKIRLLGEKFGQSWTACALAMVQGDLSVFSMMHAVTASKVGIITGIAFVITSYIKRFNNKWGNVAMTGLLTAIADYIIHPGMWMGTDSFMLPMWSESVGTGIGASILALIFISVMDKRKAK